MVALISVKKWGLGLSMRTDPHKILNRALWHFLSFSFVLTAWLKQVLYNFRLDPAVVS